MKPATQLKTREKQYFTSKILRQRVPTKRPEVNPPISETEPEATRLLGCLVQYKLIYKGSTAKMNSQTETKYRSRQHKTSQLTSGNSEFELCRESNRKWKCQTRNPLNVEEFVPSWSVAFEDVV